MNATSVKKRLRVVRDCPQPEPAPYRLIQYGAAPWSRLPHTPPAHEITIRARAQSIESKNGKRAELRSYEEALEIIAADEAAKRP